MSIILAVVALGVLILVHELGHFIAAKLSGVYVERFSIGFGPQLWSIRKGETEYCLSAIPLGGYVKMHRMFEEEEVDPEKTGQAFFNKSYPKKIFIITAGVLFNVLFAAILLCVVFMAGYKVYSPVVGSVAPGGAAEMAGFMPGDRILAVNGQEIRSWEEFLGRLEKDKGSVSVTVNRETERFGLTLTPQEAEYAAPTGEKYIIPDPGMNVYIPAVIGGVSSTFPADKAGIRAGDAIVSINGEPVHLWQDVSSHIRAYVGVPLDIVVNRGGEVLAFNVTPVAADPAGEAGIIGVTAPAGDIIQREKPWTAIALGFERTWDITKTIYYGIGQMVTGKVARENIGGPILIISEAQKSAESGLERYLIFTALISVNLAILNLLPVPVLDGGYVVMYTYEALSRRRMSLRARENGQKVGLALLGMLMIFAFYNDIVRFFG